MTFVDVMMFSVMIFSGAVAGVAVSVVRVLRGPHECSSCAERRAVEAMLEKQPFVVERVGDTLRVSQRSGRTVTGIMQRRGPEAGNAARGQWMYEDTCEPVPPDEEDCYARACIAYARRRTLTPWWRRWWVR